MNFADEMNSRSQGGKASDYESVADEYADDNETSAEEIDGKIASLLVALMASVVMLGTAADVMEKHSGHPKVQYAVATGVVSMLCCIGRLAIFRWDREAFTGKDGYMSILLVGLWSVAAALSTSKGGPFSVTNNGYFSTWIGLMAVIKYGYLSSQARSQHKVMDEIGRQNGNLVVVFVASLVEMAVAADYCDTGACDPEEANCQPACTVHEALAIVVGILSTLFVGVHLILTRNQHPLRDRYEYFLAPGLALLWIVGSAINTSAKGPFSSSCDYANGYFATWTAFFATMRYAWSVLLAFLTTGEEEQDDEAFTNAPLDQNLLERQSSSSYAPLSTSSN